MPRKIFPMTAAIFNFKMAAFSLSAYIDGCKFAVLLSSEVFKRHSIYHKHFNISYYAC